MSEGLRMGDSSRIVEVIQQHDWAQTRSGKLHTGAEVGAYRGATSALLLRTFPELTLWIVDMWKGSLPENHRYRLSGDGAARLSQHEQDDNLVATRRATDFARERRTLLKMASVRAVAVVSTPALSFVFLDAEHTLDAVREDIAAWWPKVEPGGLLCGHDYGHKRYPGVAEAVQEFSEREKLPYKLCGSCWYVQKPRGYAQPDQPPRIEYSENEAFAVREEHGALSRMEAGE